MGTTVSILTVLAGMRQAKAIKAEGRYASQIQEQNARIAGMQADDAIERGRIEASEKRLEIRGLIGEQRTIMAAQGIEINDPDSSAGHVQLSTRAQGEVDILTIKNNAAREAWGYRVQSADYQNQARLTRMAARNQANNTILTSAVAGAGTYLKYKGGLSLPKSGG